MKLLIAVSALNSGVTALAATSNTVTYDFSKKDDALSMVLDGLQSDSDTTLRVHDKGHQKDHDKGHVKGGW